MAESHPISLSGSADKRRKRQCLRLDEGGSCDCFLPYSQAEVSQLSLLRDCWKPARQCGSEISWLQGINSYVDIRGDLRREENAEEESVKNIQSAIVEIQQLLHFQSVVCGTGEFSLLTCSSSGRQGSFAILPSQQLIEIKRLDYKLAGDILETSLQQLGAVRRKKERFQNEVESLKRDWNLCGSFSGNQGTVSLLCWSNLVDGWNELRLSLANSELSYKPVKAHPLVTLCMTIEMVSFGRVRSVSTTLPIPVGNSETVRRNLIETQHDQFCRSLFKRLLSDVEDMDCIWPVSSTFCDYLAVETFSDQDMEDFNQGDTLCLPLHVLLTNSQRIIFKLLEGWQCSLHMLPIDCNDKLEKSNNRFVSDVRILQRRSLQHLQLSYLEGELNRNSLRESMSLSITTHSSLVESFCTKLVSEFEAIRVRALLQQQFTECDVRVVYDSERALLSGIVDGRPLIERRFHSGDAPKFDFVTQDGIVGSAGSLRSAKDWLETTKISL